MSDFPYMVIEPQGYEDAQAGDIIIFEGNYWILVPSGLEPIQVIDTFVAPIFVIG